MISFPLVYAFAFGCLRHHRGKQLESPLDFRVIDGFAPIEQVTLQMNNGFSNLEVIGRARTGDDVLFNFRE